MTTRSVLVPDYRRMCLWLALAGLSFGVAANSFQPTRIIAISAVAFAFAVSLRVTNWYYPVKLFFWLAMMWTVWAFASLAWSPDPISGLHEIVGLVVGFATAIALTQLCSPNIKGVETIRNGWIAAFILTVPIAVWELITNHHLPGMERPDDTVAAIGEMVGARYIAATFGNTNTYNSFLNFVLPSLLWAVASSRNRLSRYFFLVCIAAVVCANTLNASRLGMLTCVIEIVAWIWVGPALSSRRTWKTLGAVSLILFLGATVIAVSPYAQVRLALVVSGRDQSVTARSALTLNGLILLNRTYGLGIGAGGFAHAILHTPGLYSTVDVRHVIINPHNLWIEVLSQYGVPIGLGFVALLVYCFHLLRKAIKQLSGEAARSSVLALKCAIVLLLGLPINAVLNSFFLTFTILWTAIGTVLSITNFACNTLASAHTSHFEAKDFS